MEAGNTGGQERWRKMVQRDQKDEAVVQSV